MNASTIASLSVSTAALATAVGSYFVALRQARVMQAQTERLEQDLALSANASVGSAFAQITRAFLDYPELRPLFYPDEAHGAAPRLREWDERRAAALAELILDTFEEVGEFDEHPLVPWPDTYANYFDDLMRLSDYLYHQLEFRASWYPKELLNRARRARGDSTT